MQLRFSKIVGRYGTAKGFKVLSNKRISKKTMTTVVLLAVAQLTSLKPDSFKYSYGLSLSNKACAYTIDELLFSFLLNE